MTRRGTSRRAIGLKESVHDRLRNHISSQPNVTCSSYVEETLLRKHPEIFGEDAPPPPELDEVEKAAQEKRQQDARARVDQERFEQHNSEAVPDPNSKPKIRPEHLPGRLGPTPVPKVEDDRPGDEEFPPSIIMF